MKISKSVTKTIELPSGRLLFVELNPQTFISPEGWKLSKADRRAIIKFIVDFHTSLLAEVD